MSCLFCRIIRREIPASIVYEDDHVLAFNDINPQAPTHVLIVPKRHIETLNALEPGDDQIVGELARRAAAIAQRARDIRRRLSNRLQHQPRRRPDGVSHPPASARRPQHGVAPGIGRRHSLPLAGKFCTTQMEFGEKFLPYAVSSLVCIQRLTAKTLSARSSLSSPW